MIKIIITTILLSIVFISYSQDDADTLMSFQIGVKTGHPNIIGLSSEYTIPVNKYRLGICADISYLPEFSSNEKTSINLLYLSLQGNYYTLKSGKGPFTGFGYCYRKINHAKTDLSYGNHINGTSNYSYNIS